MVELLWKIIRKFLLKLVMELSKLEQQYSREIILNFCSCRY